MARPGTAGKARRGGASFGGSRQARMSLYMDGYRDGSERQTAHVARLEAALRYVAHYGCALSQRVAREAISPHLHPKPAWMPEEAS